MRKLAACFIFCKIPPLTFLSPIILLPPRLERRATNSKLPTLLEAEPSLAAALSCWSVLADFSLTRRVNTPPTKDNMAGSKTMKSRISSNALLIALAVVAAAMLAMVIAISVTKLGGNNDSSPSSASDASQANVGKNGPIIDLPAKPTPMPTLTPTVTPGNPTQSPTTAKPTNLRPPSAASGGNVPAPAPQPTAPRPTVSQITTSSTSSTPLTYKPGDLSTRSDGLLLSTGLVATVIAEADKEVEYVNGEESEEDFEEDPAGGATFPLRDGWTYVIDFDRGNDRGGVGALTFNAEGAVINYKMLLSETNENRNGGPTPWGTYISPENVDGDGSIYEVDPRGITKATRTLLGSAAGRASWSGFAYDNRRSNAPVFFVSADGKDGDSFVIRYKPSQAAINAHLFSNPAFHLLQEDEAPTVEFLVLVPTPEDPSKGIFTWVDDEDLGKDSSLEYFESVGNIEHYDGVLYLTSDERKELFVLDLDSEEYTSESTELGAFKGDPTGVKHIFKHNKRRQRKQGRRQLHAGHPHGAVAEIPADLPLLYIAESNERESGIHARNAQGQYVTILEDKNKRGDIAAVTFSPNLKHMYFALKDSGEVFMIKREDGQGFDAAAFDMSFSS